MTIIRYNEVEFSKTQNLFRQNNNDILECVKLMGKELSEINTILNTPMSAKLITEYENYLLESKKYIENKGDYFEKCFNIVKNQYAEFNQNVQTMVGDNHE